MSSTTGSAMADKFHKNITRKMQYVRTENDVVNAMTRETHLRFGRTWNARQLEIASSYGRRANSIGQEECDKQ